ncbi:RpiR family transcriptional regulator [Terrihabitans soli]|uniref:RpiR family transcriptional regulator n=1 Tax=Terrihabitans soli TaxID=708113 RepID=A0A6S6QPU5_9HYPH|nr:MurR/RpiR family transcriptional regulator [Terrihabitans soli]BCJ91506.1 RpiR family transcriptional regulator [Terrihabitans soli]
MQTIDERTAPPEGPISERIQSVLSTLTTQERRAALYLRDHYPVAGLEPLARLADASGVSAQTVLRLAGKLGFAGYRELQEHLRSEISQERSSPLGRWVSREIPGAEEDWLSGFGQHIADNVRAAFSLIVREDFEAAAQALADRKRPALAIGGRFTQSLSRYLVRHLEIVRGAIEEVGSISATWPDRLIDVDRRSVVIAYDIRRYAPDVVRFCEIAAQQGATVILFTDSRAAPASRYAAMTFVAPTESAGAWDSLSALFALTEAMIARVTELEGGSTTERLARLENIRAHMLKD